MVLIFYYSEWLYVLPSPSLRSVLWLCVIAGFPLPLTNVAQHFVWCLTAAKCGGVHHSWYPTAVHFGGSTSSQVSHYFSLGRVFVFFRCLTAFNCGNCESFQVFSSQFIWVVLHHFRYTTATQLGFLPSSQVFHWDVLYLVSNFSVDIDSSQVAYCHLLRLPRITSIVL